MHETRGSPLRREGRQFAAGWDGGAWTCVVSGGAGVRIVGGAAGPGCVLWAEAAGPGCNTKLDELHITLLRRKVDVAVISETHLNSRIDNDRISLKGYHTLRRDRNLLATNRSKGGGVAVYLNQEVMYVRTSLRSNSRKKFTFNSERYDFVTP